MQVNWYRNASEKENDKAHGAGELLQVISPANASESIAIIVSDTGAFEEKPLSLVKLVESKISISVNEIETLAAKLEEAEKEIARLNSELAKAQVAPKPAPKPVAKPAPKPVTKK
jgi:hypothetical protein